MRRAELRQIPGQLCRWWIWRRRRWRRKVSCRLTAERLHLHSSQTLFSQPLLAATLQPALQEAAETAEHDDERPDQPEAGETGQEGVGALRHHHGSDGDRRRVLPRGRKRRFQTHRTGWRACDSPLQSQNAKFWHIKLKCRHILRVVIQGGN